MNSAVLSSLAAAVFLALAAIQLGAPEVLLLLSASSLLAWLSHAASSPTARTFGHYAALTVGVVAFVITGTYL